MPVKLELGFEFTDLAKAIGGWVGMVRAFKAKLKEDAETDAPVWVVVNSAFGCAVLIFTLATVFTAMIFGSLWQIWRFFERVLPETTLQRQWQADQ